MDNKKWIFRLSHLTNYISFFVSYRFIYNKTRLTEFPESKSDMPLFHWACLHGFKIKRKQIYVMYKNLKTPAVECSENGNYHVYRKLFPAKQHFLKWIQAPENCKNQEINRIKSKKIN